MEVGQLIDSYGMGRLQWITVINAGLNRATGSMAIVMMSFLGPLLQCEWKMDTVSLALLSGAVPIGILLGSPIFGYLGDIYGRKPLLIIAAGTIAYFNLLSSLTISVPWMFFCRVCVGFGAGGQTLAAILASEFLPLSHRTFGLVILSSLWSVGVILEFFLAFVLLTTMHWRAFIAIISLISVIPPLLTIVIQESPRFLFLSNRVDEARRVLYRIAVTNNKEPYRGEIIRPSMPTKQGNPMDMFHKNYRVTSVLLFIMWILCGFITYGLLLVIAMLPDHPHRCLQNRSIIQTIQPSGDISCCRPLTRGTYFTLFMVALAEIFSYPVTGFIIDWFGRKWSLTLAFFTLSVLFILFDLCMPSGAMTALMMVAKLVAQILFNVSNIYSVEVLPTSLRSVAVGICYALSYVGSITAPFVAQTMLLRNTLGALIIFSLMSFLGALVCMLFPYETKGRRLRETVTDDVYSDVDK